jgi:hypothetical protein
MVYFELALQKLDAALAKLTAEAMRRAAERNRG